MRWPFLFITAAAIALLAAALVSHDSHKKVMIAAVNSGLMQLYDSAITEGKLNGGQVTVVMPQDLRRILLEQKPGRVFPSFVANGDVFLPKEPVAVPSDNLICVVRLNAQTFCGLTGRRACVTVPAKQLASWPHQAL